MMPHRHFPWLLAALGWAPAVFGAGPAADLARSLRENSLDPGECYRVRELRLEKQDARIFLTDGYLIFAREVGGRRTGAIFMADAEGGEAEVLLMPPDRAERRALSSYTGTPNLEERLTAAVLLFTDDTYRELIEQIQSNPFNKKSPEMGLLAAERWTPVLRNLTSSFESRMLMDVISRAPADGGFFLATMSGRKLGNFDLICDSRSSEQVLVGQVVARENRSFFDVWTSFESRAFRRQARAAGPEFDVSDYRIEATLSLDLHLSVVTKVKLKPREALRALPFDISRSMQVTAAALDGHEVEVVQRESMRSSLIVGTGNELLLLVPPQALEAGREYELEVRHEGKVVFDAGNHVYYVGARNNWYPNRGLQYATFDLTFRYPRDLDLVTPGEVVSDRTEGEWRVTRRRTGAPIRVAGFNLGRYEEAKVRRGPYSIAVYANRTVERALQPALRDPVSPQLSARRRRPELPSPPEPIPNPLSRLNSLAEEVASALDFMALRFGPPALRTLTVAPVPGRFGQGFPGLIYLSTLSYLQPDEKPVTALSQQVRLFFTDILQAHETAHQWWGNVVTAAGYHDEWLMEALANYSALLYLEKRKGARSMESALEDYKSSLLAKTEQGATVESSGPIVMGARLENSVTPQAWRAITYGKGSWIMHMLRRRMGDEKFFTMLAELRRRYDSKGVTTEQFRQLAVRYLPANDPDPTLEAFFDQWLYGTGIPALKLSYSVKGKAPAWRVVGTVSQSDVDADFSVSVPLEIQFARGKSTTQFVRTGGESAPFSFAVKQLPVRVLLDPRSSVLRR